MKNGKSENNKKILVVDDDAALLEAIKIVLEDRGYNVITSEGEDVVDIGQKEHPNLILLDYWLPKQDGDTLAKIIKSQKATQAIPIIMISANQNIKGISKVSNADGFLTKPFDIDDLLKVVENYVN